MYFFAFIFKFFLYFAQLFYFFRERDPIGDFHDINPNNEIHKNSKFKKKMIEIIKNPIKDHLLIENWKKQYVSLSKDNDACFFFEEDEEFKEQLIKYKEYLKSINIFKEEYTGNKRKT